VKKIFLILTLSLFVNLNLFSTSLTDRDILNNAERIYLNNDMNHLVEDGYKLFYQETRGTVTVFLYRKDDSYAGCRLERFSSKEKCYEIILDEKKP